MKYNNYKIYIHKVTSLIVEKKKASNSKVMIEAETTDGKMVDITSKVSAIIEIKEIPHGTLEGEYWVWPDGKKTHLRFITMAVQKMKSLPVGFFKEAKKANRPNLNQVVRKAKHLNLQCTVTKP